MVDRRDWIYRDEHASREEREEESLSTDPVAVAIQAGVDSLPMLACLALAFIGVLYISITH